jgi:dethiobiotin synthetase
VAVSPLPAAFFVSGTDTNVGKTIVSALLTLGLGAAYWKPIQSGLGEEGDTTTELSDRPTVQRLTELDDSHFLSERYRLTQPLSPHAAAAIDGIEIQLEDFHLPQNHGKSHLIVEGAGGLLVPINPQHFILDLIRWLNLPVLLVSRSTLGTINHTLLSLQALRQAQVPILGVVLNGPRNPGNRQAIEDYGQVPVLAEVEPLADLTPAGLQAAFERTFLHSPWTE